MQHHLENEFLAASFREKGAELCSLRHKKWGTEYIWEGNPRIWGRHAPILFPIVGRLKDNQYYYNNKPYQMSQHGFARDMDWQAVEETSDSITFELNSSAETQENFPFHWQLHIYYQLTSTSLITRYQVKHNGKEEEMYFSIGGHPAFCCPLEANLHFNDYFLEFEQTESASRQHLTGGLRNGKTEKVLSNNTKLPLTVELFNDDALIFSDLNSNKVSLKSDSGERGLHFHFNNFPYLGIWSKAGGAPFVCIEPWYGIADTESGQHGLPEKEGILKLRPGQTFSCQYQIEVF